MNLTRREFLRQIGLGATSLAAAWMLEGCQTIGIPTAAPTLPGAPTVPTRSAPTPLAPTRPSPTLLTPTLTPAPTPTVPPIAARIAADASRVVGACDPKLWGNLGFDPMYWHTVAPTTQPVWEMIRASRAFRYIRCHNLFSDAAPNARPNQIYGCRIYAEDASGAPRYNFQYLDEVLDVWLRAGLKPILEMDFMPDALAEGTLVRNYGGGAINTPRDYAEWRELIYQTAKHLIARYSADEVRSWYFEIWNEPDLQQYFIDGSPGRQQPFTPERLARFCKMYDYFVDGATAADAHLRVGGPGIAGHEDFLRVFLDHITRGTNAVTGRRGTRADFISWHGYNTSQGLLESNRRKRALVRNYPALANVELHQNEWGQTINRLDQGQNATVLSEFDAAFLCRSIDNNFEHADARVDLFLRWGQLVDNWRAHTRAFAGVNVPLPIFNAYLLLGKLGPERLAVEHTQPGANVRAFAARRGVDSAQIVLYRFEEENPDGTGAPVGVELTVRGLPGAALPLNLYRLDREHANAYRAWVALGSPKQPTRAQAERLAAQAKLDTETSSVTIEAGAARVALALPPNGMTLVMLGKEAQ